MLTLGTRVQAARNHLGLSRSELTEKLGWKRAATIHEIEGDRAGGIRAERAADLARALLVDLDWLVTGKPEHAPEWAKSAEAAVEPEAAQ